MILEMHRQGWAIAGKTSGVVYICGDRDRCDRIHRVAYENALIDRDGSGWLSITLLDTIKAETIEASNANRLSQAGEPGARAA